YFKKSQNQTGTVDGHSGTGGPLDTADARMHHVLNDAFLEGAEAAGIGRIRDFNGPSNEGAGPYQQNLRGRWRHSTASAFLRPARNRSNLIVQTNAQVMRVIIENGAATGVEYRRDGKVERAFASGEVVLSGG